MLINALLLQYFLIKLTTQMNKNLDRFICKKTDAPTPNCTIIVGCIMTIWVLCYNDYYFVSTLWFWIFISAKVHIYDQEMRICGYSSKKKGVMWSDRGHILSVHITRKLWCWMSFPQPIRVTNIAFVPGSIERERERGRHYILLSVHV